MGYCLDEQKLRDYISNSQKDGERDSKRRKHSHEKNPKEHIFFLKPYRPMSDENGNEIIFPFDKARICARAIGNALPYEMVDVQLSRQSI